MESPYSSVLAVCHRVKLVYGPAGVSAGIAPGDRWRPVADPRKGRAGSSDPAAVEGRPPRAPARGPCSLRCPASLHGPGHAFHGLPARRDRCPVDIGPSPARLITRPGVCNETGRNSEPGANPAETPATHHPTHLRDTTLVSALPLRRSSPRVPRREPANESRIVAFRPTRSALVQHAILRPVPVSNEKEMGLARPHAAEGWHSPPRLRSGPSPAWV